MEISSDFPPEPLLGRVERLAVRIDRLMHEGVPLRDLQIALRGVDVSVQSPSRGDLERRDPHGFLEGGGAGGVDQRVPGRVRLGAGGREDRRPPQGVVYWSTDAFFGFPVSIGLDLRVAGPRAIEVVPQEATVGEFGLPPPFSYAHSLPEEGH